jgi:hypothetical protein
MKRYLPVIIILATAFGTLAYLNAQAHGGGLDAFRCHMNHKTNIYHCH